MEINAFLDSFEIVETNSEIRRKVIDYRKKKKIKIPDAIIIATASWLEADLLTNNVKAYLPQINTDERG